MPRASSSSRYAVVEPSSSKISMPSPSGSAFTFRTSTASSRTRKFTSRGSPSKATTASFARSSCAATAMRSPRSSSPTTSPLRSNLWSGTTHAVANREWHRRGREVLQPQRALVAHPREGPLRRDDDHGGRHPLQHARSQAPRLRGMQRAEALPELYPRKGARRCRGTHGDRHVPEASAQSDPSLGALAQAADDRPCSPRYQPRTPLPLNRGSGG